MESEGGSPGAAQGPDPGAGPALIPVPDGRTFLERHGISSVTFAWLCVVFLFVVYQVVGSAVSVLIFGLSPDLTEPGAYRVFTGTSQLLLMLLPALLVTNLASADSQGYLRLNRPTIPVMLVPLGGIFSLQQMLQVYLVFQGKIPLPVEVEKLVNQLREAMDQALLHLLGSDSVPEFLGVVVIIAVIPGLVEEIAFRGLIQGSFERGLGPARGIVITGIIFGAFHLNPFSMVPLIALGIYLGFLAYRADSVWVSVAAHAFNNLIPVAALSSGLVDEKVITGDLGDLPFGLLMAVFWFSGVIFLLSTYYFIHLTRKPDAGARGAPHP